MLATGRSTAVEFPLEAEISDNRVVTDELKPPPIARRSAPTQTKMRNAFRRNLFIIMGRLFHPWQPAKNTFSPFLDLKRRLGKLSDE